MKKYSIDMETVEMNTIDSFLMKHIETVWKIISIYERRATYRSKRLASWVPGGGNAYDVSCEMAAEVITVETGIRFEYSHEDFGADWPYSYISMASLLPWEQTEKEKQLSKEEYETILASYATELGLTYSTETHMVQPWT